MAILFVRSAFNYDADVVSRETGLECLDETRAQQNFRDETDINTIVRRFGLTGQLPDAVRVPEYGDFAGFGSYHDALNAVRVASEQFMSLPGELRARFGNDPDSLMGFLADPGNRDEAIKLGLVNPVEPAAAAPVVRGGSGGVAPAGGPAGGVPEGS